MAVSRSTAVKSDRPTLADDLEYIAAQAELQRLSADATAAETVWQEASARGAHETEADVARSRLSGAAIAEVVDIDSLAREVRISKLAVAQQQKIVDELADQLERDSVGDDRSRNDEMALGVLQSMRELQERYRSYLEFQADRRRRFNGRCSLPLVQIDPRAIGLLNTSLAQFQDGLAHFGIAEGE